MALAEDDVFIKAALLRSAQRCGLKLEVLAALMGITPPQLSMQLRPGGHVSVVRLLSVAKDDDGRRFLQMFWHDVAEHIGIQDFDAVAAELKRFHGRLGVVVDKLQVRMAKSELRQIERERNIA